jgi:hypothetical protein
LRELIEIEEIYLSVIVEKHLCVGLRISLLDTVKAVDVEYIIIEKSLECRILEHLPLK